MRVRKNLTMGGLIMLVALGGVIAAGCVWYSHAKSVRLREERSAKVASSEAKIVVHKDDIKNLEADKQPIEAEVKSLEQKIKAAQEATNASSAKTKELNGYLVDFRRKMDEARRAAEQNNREVMQQTTNRNRSGNSDAAKIRLAESNVMALQKELEKSKCHYECMGRSKPTKKEKLSDDGVWVYDTITNNPLYWRCRKHGYTFTQIIEYLDHKNEVSRLTAEIGKQQRLIAELRNQATAEAEKQTANAVRFDQSAWNAKYAEYQEVARRAQDAADEDRNALDKLTAEKRELDSKLADIEKKIENNESNIKNERLCIAENQK